MSLAKGEHSRGGLMDSIDDFPDIDLEALDRQKEQNRRERLALMDRYAKRVRLNLSNSGQRREHPLLNPDSTADFPVIELDQLALQKEQNFKERMALIDRYAEWVQAVPNEVWSHQQAKIINRPRN